MSTATLSKKPKAKREFQNGFGVEDRFLHDPANRNAAAKINDTAAGVSEDIADWKSQPGRILANAWDLTVREILEAAEQFKTGREPLRERVKAQIAARQELLPFLRPGCLQAVARGEVEFNAVVDELEAQHRANGIDEYSLPGGAAAGANPVGTRELLRRRLAQEPAALAAMGRWNKAIETLAVLESMLLIQATHETADSYLRLPAVESTLPKFITNLFA